MSAHAVSSTLRPPVRVPRPRRTAPSVPTPVDILGIELQPVDLAGAAKQVVALAHSGAGGIVVTPNVDHVVKLRDSRHFRDAYDAAVLRYADGMPLVWLARLLGRPLPARVAGADLVPLVLELAEQQGLGVHLVGGSPEVAEEAARRVQASHPVLRWTGHVSPPWGFEQDAVLDRGLAETVARAKPDIVLVCLGAPKQEAWALRHARRLDGAVLLCVGASVNFLAGSTSRAPGWVSRAGLEWLYRLCREPGRLWRRYLVDDPRFLALAVNALRTDRGPRSPRAGRG
jgi:N-acetylglucosaminyldiphosphoundecaprenol N-acetyl-beta-D-mannosaminyltransferase